MLTQLPRARGFTLIELLVTMVIGSILLSIAVPSYQSQIRKSRRTEARAALLDLASREERYLSTYNQYTSDAASLGYGVFPTNVGSDYYQVLAPVVNPAGANAPPTFILKAQPLSGSTQANDADCQTFVVDSTGAQSATGAAGDTTATCWK
jgi:type IV pilus assembly protein PilE